MTKKNVSVQNIAANLARLPEGVGRTVMKYEGFQAGGGGEVERTAARLDDASIRETGDNGTVEIRFERSGGSVEAVNEWLEFPQNWREYDRLQATVTNGPRPLTLEMIVLGARSRLIERRLLAANEQTVIDLNLRDLPLTAGSRAAYEPTGVRFAAVWHESEGHSSQTDWDRARYREKWSDGGAVSISIHRLELLPRDGEIEPVVDRFGQRASTTWPDKIKSESQLLAQRDAEAAALAEQTEPVQTDAYGGWLDGPQLEGTGYFRTYQDEQGKWWYVTPGGRLFWSIGTTGIRLTDDTTILGREELYEALPQREGMTAKAWHGEASIGLYKWNVLRKYKGDLMAWANRVAQRWRKWGFNTVGSWSELELMTQTEPRLVYTVFFHARNAHTPVASGRFPDVFDPSWLRELEKIVASATAEHVNNPWLLGYFVDNEHGWKRPRLLAGPLGSVMRERWASFARERFGNLDVFNAAFNSTCTSWEQVRDLQDDQVPTSGRGSEAMRDFEGLYAEQYFRLINQTIKQHDPNHLYLGCRFIRQRPDEQIVRASGRYCDVVTINSYDLYPKPEQFEEWYELGGGKPLMLGEHHLPLFSERQLPPLYPAFTAEERIGYYIDAQRRWLDQPWSVGAHWFQHADQHLTGRGMDGENQTVGFVDITDQPHAHLVEAARVVTAEMYQRHAGQAAPRT